MNEARVDAGREVILERVRKLLALARNGGAAVGEISTAMKMATRLMAQFQLAEEDLRVGTDKAGAVRVNVTTADVADAAWRGSALRTPGWQEVLGSASALATGCHCYYSGRGVVFVGAFRDAAVAVAIQAWLVARCETDTREFLRSASRDPETSSRSIAASYRHGWVAGVYEAVTEEVAARRSDTVQVRRNRATGEPGTDLVLLRMGDVTEAKDAAVRSWMQLHVGKLRSSRSSVTVGNAGAYHRGAEHGRSVRVGNGANLD